MLPFLLSSNLFMKLLVKQQIEESFLSNVLQNESGELENRLFYPPI